MNNKPVVLSVYSRTYKAANDDGSSSGVQQLPKRRPDRDEMRLPGGWDPYEVWRTRVLGSSRRRPDDR